VITRLNTTRIRADCRRSIHRWILLPVRAEAFSESRVIRP
jgi:hypothetical protein